MDWTLTFFHFVKIKTKAQSVKTKTIKTLRGNTRAKLGDIGSAVIS
jgi:hypothetical protein